jgi:hypothetical protein
LFACSNVISAPFIKSTADVHSSIAASIISPIAADRFLPRLSTFASLAGVMLILIFATNSDFGFGTGPRFFFGFRFMVGPWYHCVLLCQSKL